MNELTNNELSTLIRLVKNLLNANYTWENKDLLEKLEKEYFYRNE